MQFCTFQTQHGPALNLIINFLGVYFLERLLMENILLLKKKKNHFIEALKI